MMCFEEKTAVAMEEYTKLAGIDKPDMWKMSAFDIAIKFQAGVHQNKFSTSDVRQLIEEMKFRYPNQKKTELFFNIFDFLRKKLHLGNDLAHCMALGLNVSGTKLLDLTNDEIQESLDPALLEDWLKFSDFKLLLNKLDLYYPNRLQRNQSSTASSRANPYVVLCHLRTNI